MHISDFDYPLPPELIAREPARPRDSSRMMLVDRTAGAFVDSTFRSLPNVLHPGDVLVINDTRVMRARMYGVLERRTGTTRPIEVLFANPVTSTTWEVLCKPGKRVRPGDRVVFGEGVSIGTFGDTREHGLKLLTVTGTSSVTELLQRFGHLPLPPYMERPARDSDAIAYQTMFAEHSGAVAAPTAGLHFTPEVIEALASRGIDAVGITLHVGIGTFLPVRTEDPREHWLKPEWFNIPEVTAERLNSAKETGNRIIAVGTTSTRTLEDVFSKHGRFHHGSGYAGMYILPGHRFQAIDGLLTNFHLPRSTLLMLVSSFAGRELTLRAYAHAVEKKYRFYSYGDCMLVL